MAVHALLAQDGHLGAGELQRGRCTRVECEVHMQPRVVGLARRRVLHVGARRVVAQLRDAPAHLVPRPMQRGQRRAEHRLRVAPHLDHAAVVRLADGVAHSGQPMAAQRLHHRVALGGGDLDDHPQLLVEQRPQRELLAARAHLAGPVLRVAVFGAAVGDAVAFGDQQVDVEAHAEMAGERHLAHRCPQAAVAAIVVREQLAVATQLADGRHQRLQGRGVVEVRNAVGIAAAEAAEHLGEHRARHATPPGAHVDEDERGVARLQLRRERGPHVVQRGEGRDDERHRRGHLQRLPVLVPAGAHRQAVLAHRHADAQRRAELEADRLHRVVQRRILAGLAAGGHPVAAQLHALELDRCRQQVGEGLADRHATRRGRIERGERRALAHRHRLAAKARVVGERDRAVGHRHLPRAHHRVAVIEPAHRAVADGDQEALAGHRGMAQHVERHLLQRDAGQHQRGVVTPEAGHGAMHLRRLAEQHVHRHVDRRIALRRTRRGAGGAIVQHELLLVGGHTDHRVRAALARAHRLEQRQRRGRHRHHVALLALVAPDLLRREARFLERHLGQVEARAAVRAVHQLGEGVRDAASAHVVDGEDGVGVAQRPAVVDDLLRAALDLGVAALHRIEVEVGGVGARGHRAGRAAAHADAHAGPAELDQQRTRGQRALRRMRVVDVADASGEHDGFVVTAEFGRRRAVGGNGPYLGGRDLRFIGPEISVD